jgi:uncharacterized protein VirK/YbjX
VESISLNVLLNSDLISNEEFHRLVNTFAKRPQLSAIEIIRLDLPSKNRVEALLQTEFMREYQLRELSCDFAEHVLSIYESHALFDRCPHRCIELARLYLAGSANLKELQDAIKEAIPKVWTFERTECHSAFQAGLASTFLNHTDAADMARIIAAQAQKAAHSKEREKRRSNVEPMIA